MNSHTPLLLELIGDANFGCRVTFRWQEDRFRHRIGFFSGDQYVDLLDSADDARREDLEWPASPPLQQIHFEDRDDGQVALGVGMAGKTHWSASFESQRTNAMLHFDLAARVQRSPRFLGSSYRILHPDFQTENSAVVFHAFGRTVALEIDSEKETSWQLLEGLLLVTPTTETSLRLPFTKRWQFSLRLRQ